MPDDLINAVQHLRLFLLFLAFAVGVATGGGIVLYLALLRSTRTKNPCCRPSYAANQTPPNDLLWRSKSSRLRFSQRKAPACDKRFFYGFSLN